MHYDFCRKHTDQTGEGGCPECAMNNQQATISAMTETAKESSRVHVEMHNQIVALQEEVARLKGLIDRTTKYEARRIDLASALAYDSGKKAGAEAALRWAWNEMPVPRQDHYHDDYIQRGIRAVCGEGEHER